jgi:queuine tRNA-ribosyltransferase
VSTLDVELVTLKSGARAVRDRLTGEVMHSAVGPKIESQELYVLASRLRERLEEGGAPLVLLDVGLGAGSNAALAFAVSESLSESARKLSIVSFDRSTAAMELALGSDDAVDLGFSAPIAEHGRALLSKGTTESARTAWKMVLGDLPDTLSVVADRSADIVFWDPFSPKSNPTLWNMAAFRALFRACRDGCTVHTYSQATRVRSAMLLAGFHVGLGSSTGVKEATTIAGVGAPPGAALLDARWLDRLTRSSAPFPDDAPCDALARIMEHPQLIQR